MTSPSSPSFVTQRMKTLRLRRGGWPPWPMRRSTSKGRSGRFVPPGTRLHCLERLWTQRHSNVCARPALKSFPNEIAPSMSQTTPARSFACGVVIFNIRNGLGAGWRERCCSSPGFTRLRDLELLVAPQNSMLRASSAPCPNWPRTLAFSRVSNGNFHGLRRPPPTLWLPPSSGCSRVIQRNGFPSSSATKRTNHGGDRLAAPTPTFFGHWRRWPGILRSSSAPRPF